LPSSWRQHRVAFGEECRDEPSPQAHDCQVGLWRFSPCVFVGFQAMTTAPGGDYWVFIPNLTGLATMTVRYYSRVSTKAQDTASQDRELHDHAQSQ
jgi:hypothetical protein